MAQEAVARPAATIVLLRDTPDGMEVFMMVRHHALDFAAGALVFPGGRVEEQDLAIASNPEFCPNPTGWEPAAMAFRIAAIRETFEECGVLLAHKRGAEALIDGNSLRTIEQTHRAKLTAGSIGFDAVLTAYDLVPATERLTCFAHWITPKHQPKRYDTHFFLAAAPEEHLAAHDGGESVDSLWMTPREVLREAEAGRFRLVFATQMNLMKLANFRTVLEAVTHAFEAEVVTVLPEFVRVDGTRRVMRIPLEAGYGAAEFLVENPPAS